MADPQQPKPPNPAKEARLAQALRANLRRRKAAAAKPSAVSGPEQD